MRLNCKVNSKEIVQGQNASNMHTYASTSVYVPKLKLEYDLSQGDKVGSTPNANSIISCFYCFKNRPKNLEFRGMVDNY